MIMTRTWLPKVMRSGKMKKAAMATSHGSTSAGLKRWRRSRYSAARSRACLRSAATVTVSLAAIEPRRLDQQHNHGDRVDEKAAGIRQQIFSGGVEYAEQIGRASCRE